MARYYAKPVEAEQYLPNESQIPAAATMMISSNGQRIHYYVYCKGDYILLEDGEWVVVEGDSVQAVMSDEQFNQTYVSALQEETPASPQETEYVWWVKFTGRERGWGGEMWYRDFAQQNDANEAIRACNAKNTDAEAPDYYIVAEMEGWYPRDHEPFLKEYKF